MQTPWGDLEVSDAHVHFFSRRFFETLGAQCGKDAAEVAAIAGFDFPGTTADLAHRWAAEFDAYSVARSSLIASVPGDEASVTAAMAACPGRFFAFAMVNPLAENAAIAHGLHAICLFPAMHRFSLHDPRVEALLAQAALRRCAVFVHCGVLTVGIRKKLGLPSPFDMRFSNPLDLHAIALRFPQIDFIVPHFGAGYFREALMLADLCPNVHLDTSSTNSWMRYEGLDLQTVLRRALDVAGPRRLLFGTDSSFFPRGWNQVILELQVHALNAIGISASDAKAILGGNLQRILAA
ncbi:MAG TPA: amidohydrolase family protein [Candidatus Sulfopaludibacter sp.]|nr:amidohydrolase family protein [Candidatus Sulfopaludibacter sp.]